MLYLGIQYAKPWYIYTKVMVSEMLCIFRRIISAPEEILNAIEDQHVYICDILSLSIQEEKWKRYYASI